MEEREKAVAGREAELAELEAGREARASELEGVRDRLALLEKGLEGQRADLSRRKVFGCDKRGVFVGASPNRRASVKPVHRDLS